MAQEIIPPDDQRQTIPKSGTETQIIENTIETLKGKMGVVDQFRARMAAGNTAATVVVEMQKDVAMAYREIVKHHANLIARARKMELSDKFQEATLELTRRVDKRVAEETKYYWSQLHERETYYEDFFEDRIRETNEKVDAGILSRDRADTLIQRYEKDRDIQQGEDRNILDNLKSANVRVVHQALRDFDPAV